MVQVRCGFEYLGHKIKPGNRKRHLPESKIRSQANRSRCLRIPRQKSASRFMDQLGPRTKRTMPLKTEKLIVELNPLV
jgi:hypothetical protein